VNLNIVTSDFLVINMEMYSWNELTDLADDWCNGTITKNIRTRAIVENELRTTTGTRVAIHVPFIVTRGSVQLVLPAK
jgi:hypothetical protein